MVDERSECVLCKIIRDDEDVPFASVMGREHLAGQTLVRRSRARVIFDVAPVVPGHILIVTEDHYSSLARCDEPVLEDVLHLKELMSERLQASFSIPPVWFEHGECHDKAGDEGCRVYHTHLHGVPAPPEVFDVLREQLEFRPIRSLSSLREISREESYLYIESPRNGPEVSITTPSSQVLRKTICNALGVGDRWNWHDQYLFDSASNRARIETAQARLAP